MWVNFEPKPVPKFDENSYPIFDERYFFSDDNALKKVDQEMIAMGLGMAVDFISSGATVAADMLVGPEASVIARPVVAGTVQFCTSLAHSAINGKSMDFDVYLNAAVAGTGVALGYVPGIKGVVISSVYEGGTTLVLGGNSKEATSNSAIAAGEQVVSESIDEIPNSDAFSGATGLLFDHIFAK